MNALSARTPRLEQCVDGAHANVRVVVMCRFDGGGSILLVIAGGQDVQRGAVYFWFRVIRQGHEPAMRDWRTLIAQGLRGAHPHRHQ